MKETAPLWSMRGRSAYKHTEKVPGPGTYSPLDVMMQTSPKYRVGTAKRKSLAENSFTPGPGAYSPIKSRDMPSWTM
jgi:Sperm-tail PG-rich repeat